MEPKKIRRPASGPTLFSLMRGYRTQVALLVALTVAANALSLAVPKIVAGGIDAYVAGHFVTADVLFRFVLVAFGICLFTFLQNVVQVYASERVARDLRSRVAAKISEQDYASVQQATSAKLLTNLTSDVDAVKNFVAQAVSSIIASAFLVIGASVLLLLIDWKLAAVVLLVVPVVGGTYFVVFGKVRKLFRVSQESIDALNRVINESILGSSLIRLLNAQKAETAKFMHANAKSRDIGMSILRLFAGLIPFITFATSGATLVILVLGGHFVIARSMTIGDFMAFNNYLAILIFPILVLGFMSNVIAQASASFVHINEVLERPARQPSGTLVAMPGGDVSLEGARVTYGEKFALRDVSFVAKAGTRTAIIGPTAAGKTQLLYLLTGLVAPTAGTVSYAGRPLTDYDPVTLHRQIAFVFQDSILFNLTLRENIAFGKTVEEADMRKAIDTAELHEFVGALENGLETVVSERGTSLSGGQKQRVMLARALALNPSVLLLDDFTARVDVDTERRILANVARNYPGITLISVTQKIASAERFDQIVLLMEGELLARGTHAELLASCPEYVQIFESQRSTSAYELRAE